jgi:hypothetical protein
MRKIKEVLRLRYELKFDQRQVARSCSIAVSTVHEYLKRAEAARRRDGIGRRSVRPYGLRLDSERRRTERRSDPGAPNVNSNQSPKETSAAFCSISRTI